MKAENAFLLPNNRSNASEITKTKPNYRYNPKTLAKNP
jgi:hypothetical protein